MDAEKLLVHNSSQREAIEGVHTYVVYSLRVLDFAYSERRGI